MRETVLNQQRMSDVQTMVHRSWLKLDKITLIPLFSLPRRFSTGTLTLSKVIYDVPAVGFSFDRSPSDTLRQDENATNIEQASRIFFRILFLFMSFILIVITN